MSAAMVSVAHWAEGLKRIFGGLLHGHTSRAMAALSLAMAWSGSCRGLDLGGRWPGEACPASLRRRLERLLANERLKPDKAFDAMCAWVGRQRRGKHLVLILDESDRDDRLRSLQLLAAWRSRALPMWITAYRPGESPMKMPELIDLVLRRVAVQLGRDVTVTLLVDRGLAWPKLIRTCQDLGWHFVMRVQGSVRVRMRDGTVTPARELWDGRRPLTRIDGVAMFAKAGFIKNLSLSIAWEKGCAAPWLLVSDTPAGYEAVRRYCRRMWCEQTFRDQKSFGLHWRESRVNDPVHATRLLLLIGLCQWLCLLCGRLVEQRGLRHWFDPHRKRRLSLFRLGQLHLQRLAAKSETTLLLPLLS